MRKITSLSLLVLTVFSLNLGGGWRDYIPGYYSDASQGDVYCMALDCTPHSPSYPSYPYYPYYYSSNNYDHYLYEFLNSGITCHFSICDELW